MDLGMKFDFDISDKKLVFEYLSKVGTNVNGRLTRECGFEKNFPDLYEQFIKYKTNNEIDEMPFIQRLWYFLQDLYEPVKCHYCSSNITPFNGFKYGHQKYCCIEHMNKDDEHKQSVNDGIINNFGSFDEYIRIRNEKSVETCMKKYNVKNAGGYIDYVKKGIETKSINKRIKNGENISIDKPTHIRSEKYLKRNQTITKENKRKNWLNRVMSENDDIISIDSNNILLCKCDDCDCNMCLEKIYKIPYDLYIKRKKKGLKKCFRLYKKQSDYNFATSIGEKELGEYIKSIYSGNIIYNTRQVLENNYEIDIFLPDLNLGFEYNGDFWHANPDIYDESFINPCSKKSFKELNDDTNNKIIESKQKGVNLIIVWENDWLNNNEDTKKRIKDILDIWKRQ